MEMKIRKKWLSGLLAAVCVVSIFGMTARAANIQCDNQIPATEIDSVFNQEIQSNALIGWPTGPNIYSESGIVMDMDSGAILYAKNIDDQHYPASITKVMTALVALENFQMTDRVKFTQSCIDFLEYGDAHIGMKVEEEISMEDAMYAMLLASANEVSYAIANTDAGGYDSFIHKMNEKATQLGCRNSHWVNANGLHNDEHYTSARDMALIGSAVFQYEQFRTITATHQHTIPATNLTAEGRTFQQNHKMLYQGNRNYYEFCVGGKTGFTDQALTTLVTFAQKEGKNLVAVTLRTHGGGQNAYVDTRAMLDYAFDNFRKVPITKEEFDEKNIESVADNSYLMLPEGITLEKLERTFDRPEAEGDKNGTFRYIYEGQEVGQVDAVITQTYYNKLHGIEEKKEEATDDKTEQEKKGEKEKQKKKDASPFRLIVAIAGVVIVVLFLIYVLLVKRKRRIQLERRKRKRQQRKNARKRKNK